MRGRLSWGNSSPRSRPKDTTDPDDDDDDIDDVDDNDAAATV